MARPAAPKVAAQARQKTGTKADEKHEKIRTPANDVAAAQLASERRALDPWVEDEAALAALDATRPLALPTHHDRARLNAGSEGKPKPVRVLVIDVGGTNVKVLATGHMARRATPSGPELTPQKMVKAVQALTRDWTFDVVSIGYPGPVVRGRIAANPAHLGDGWIGFDFEKAFGRPTLIINDAAMQALGSYQGGNMLFLGLGTGLGSALVAQGHLHPLELAHLPYRKGKTYEDYLGKRGLRKLGKKAWRKRVLDVAARLMAAMQVDELVIGGGNASLLRSLPAHARLGENANAFKGGFRLWGPPAPARR